MANAPTIAIIDYHKGNLSSVARGLARAGATAVVTDDPAQIRAADGLVLPGVGSFYDAISFMHEAGQDEAVLDAVRDGGGVPFLGICLGLQLLFDRGDEGVPPADAVSSDVHAPASEAACPAGPYGEELAPGTVFEAEGRRWVRGLGLLHGSCTMLPSRRLKVPHVGWDQVHLAPAGQDCPLLQDLAEGANLYFTHSFAVDDDVEAASVAARTHYARNFSSVVWRGNLYGCQFHPEKSSAHGLEILRSFVSIVSRQADARR